MQEFVYVIDKHHAHDQWQEHEEPTHDTRADAHPVALSVQVPHIYIIGKRLSQQDGEVVAEEAIDNHQQGAQEAEQPVEGGGDHTPLPLAHNPLYRDASREEELGQEPNGVDE